jgi:two-component system cell cycle sensor histidine kinase/response regulator CckA
MFELLMRTGADAVVLKGPPWWTAERLANAAALLGGAAMLLILYLIALHRQVRRQTAVIREQLQREAALQEQFRQAQKMEAVGRLAGGIAHNFNNLMTVVIGHSDVLSMREQIDADQLASLNEIRGAADRASKLTRQLLAFGRQQTLAISPVDLNVVVRDVVALIGGVMGDHLTVQAEPAPEPVIISTDRSQLEQALLNLAVNARDAMQKGGILRVTAGRRQTTEGTAVGVLAVSDTGHGIAPEAQPYIFEPFFSTKDAASGSGLGLAMVYGFVQQAGGTVTFTTTPGQGTTFELAFPLAPETGP